MRLIIIYLSLHESQRSRNLSILRSSRCYRFSIVFFSSDYVRQTIVTDDETKGMAFTGMLIGHSFVSGLHDHFTRGGRYPTVPADIPRRLTVKRWVDQFHLIGQRGSCVLPMHELPYNLTDIRPDFAIVDNGGNDLASTHSPLSVADAVITIAHNILNVHHARHVTVCSALYRTKNTGSYSVTDYNHRVGRFNNILRHFCDTEQDITYHTHRGFWQCPLHVWSHDGTHPNTAHGRKLYIKSLRRATHCSVKHVTRK